MSKNFLIYCSFISSSFLLTSCAAIGDSIIMRTMAYHPNAWIAQAFVIYADQQKLKKASQLSAENAMKEAEQCVARGDDNRAMEYWLLAVKKGRFDALLKMGECYEKHKQVSKAYLVYSMAKLKNVNVSNAKLLELEGKLSAKEKLEVNAALEEIKLKMNSKAVSGSESQYATQSPNNNENKSTLPEVRYNSTLGGDKSRIYNERHGYIERDAFGPGIGMDEYGRQVRVRESSGAQY